jgi:hypothetical protein
MNKTYPNPSKNYVDFFNVSSIADGKITSIIDLEVTFTEVN